jgi:predicted transcriptional regulator
MRKTKRDEPMQMVPLRLPPDLIRRLDRLAERIEKERPGMRVTRSDAARMALLRGLEEEDR